MDREVEFELSDKDYEAILKMAEEAGVSFDEYVQMALRSFVHSAGEASSE